jgi:hypothetical protein
MARSASPDAHVPGSLARLLETETRLEALLAEARERAEGLIGEAVRQAKGREAALKTELAEAAALAERRRAEDGAQQLAALSRESELALGRLRSIGPERVSELAHWVANQVLDGGLAPDRP